MVMRTPVANRTLDPAGTTSTSSPSVREIEDAVERVRTNSKRRFPGRLSLALLGGCVVAASLAPVSARATATDAAAEAEARYRLIPARNVFRLRPPPATPEPKIQQPALPKLILTGITTILDTKRVLLIMQAAGARPGEAGGETSLILAEGQREGPIEILQIDEANGRVQLKNSGTPMTLSFERDGRTLPATAAPTPAGGPAPRTDAPPGATRMQIPSNHPAPPPAANAPITAAGSPLPAGNAQPQQPLSAAAQAVSSDPSHPSRPSQAQPPLNAIEQAILIEAQRQFDSGNPNSNPSAQLLPPMPLR